MTEVAVRAMRAEDATAVAALSTQLGYPSTPEQTVQRFARIAGSADQLALVAEAADRRVVGWAHFAPVVNLESEPYIELTGLVVDAAHRSRRIGERLVQGGLAWAADRGFAEVRVRSNVVRADAHRFYERLGFRLRKTQKVFARPLG
ncbi:MAG: GNAT family N-acetyltransferase [Acidobacteriota bacterium]